MNSVISFFSDFPILVLVDYTISVQIFYGKETHVLPVGLSKSWKTKKTKTKLLSFYKQQLYFSQIVSKKANIAISFSMKNSKHSNIILGFSFMYLVSVYSTKRTRLSEDHLSVFIDGCDFKKLLDGWS